MQQEQAEQNGDANRNKESVSDIKRRHSGSEAPD
jgi:hypothetical protein